MAGPDGQRHSQSRRLTGCLQPQQGATDQGGGRQLRSMGSARVTHAARTAYVRHHHRSAVRLSCAGCVTPAVSTSGCPRCGVAACSDAHDALQPFVIRPATVSTCTILWAAQEPSAVWPGACAVSCLHSVQGFVPPARRAGGGCHSCVTRMQRFALAGTVCLISIGYCRRKV